MAQWRGKMRMRRLAAALVCSGLLGATARGQAVGRAEKDVVYGTVGGRPLMLDVYLPAEEQTSSRAVLIRFGPKREAPSGAAGDLLKQNVVLIYAGFLPVDASASGPDSRHVFSLFPQDVQAAKAAIRWARGNAGRLSLNKDRIGVWGSGYGATIAALVGVTPDQKELNGAIGSFTSESTAVRAMCLFEGITDWRNAELYGDETVNVPGSPAYQLFGGNPKDHTDEARQASAVNYIRPTSPATLMVTLASDEQRAMHLIFAQTLRNAGVRSALYEEPAGSARGVDEEKLNKTVLEFFNDTLLNAGPKPAAMPLDAEIKSLTDAGLFKQARRLVDEQLSDLAGMDAATLSKQTPWLKKLREINDLQQAPAVKQLLDAKKAGVTAAGATGSSRTLWTIREVLTDPDRIGQYSVEALVTQREYDSRADALKFVETLNAYILRGDASAAERHANVMRDIAKRGDADPAILNRFLARYDAIKGNTSRVWPAGLRGVPYARDFGQDLYGYWMDVQAGGVTQRMRYVPPGKFAMGSGKDEWGRLPGEPILEPTTIARGFWLADSPVTQAMWEGVMGKEENHAAFRLGGNSAEVRLNLPIENISYAHAVNFLNKFGLEARLPTEAEWEYACRAGSTYMYSGTGRLSDMAWFWDEKRDKAGNAPSSGAPAVGAGGEVDIQILHELETDQSQTARLTHPVKQKLPNAWGLYDMQGNVWEWCAGTSPDKPRDYHAAKGGSWISIPQSCRAARDVWFPVEFQAWNVGMRICMPAQ